MSQAAGAMTDPQMGSLDGGNPFLPVLGAASPRAGRGLSGSQQGLDSQLAEAALPHVRMAFPTCARCLFL